MPKKKQVKAPAPVPSPSPSVTPQTSDDDHHEDHQEEQLEETEEIAAAAAISRSASPSTSKVKKSRGGGRKKVTCRLKSEELEADVLEWVCANECLWNMKNRDFKNRARKEGMWQDKAGELGIEMKMLKTWYTDLRDWNTKLQALKSGDPARIYTDREAWVMERFAFLKATIRHRRAPVKSVKQAIAMAEGDLGEAERISAEDHINIMTADQMPESGASSSRVKKKLRMQTAEDDFMEEMRSNIASAHSQMKAATAAQSQSQLTE